MGEIFIDETGTRRSNMLDENTFIRIQDKTPVVGNIGRIVRGDTNSNIITFEMERYHDGEDLKDKDIRIIIKNKLGVYVEDAYDIRYSNIHLRFSWLLSSADTLNGDAEVTVEVYGTSSIGKPYSLNSTPFILNIEESLSATDDPVNIPDNWFTVTDSRLTNLENDMSNLQGSLNLSAYQTKIDFNLQTTAKQIDMAINELNAKSHEHNNLGVLDKLDVSNTGELTYDGNTIGGMNAVAVGNLIDQKVPVKITTSEKSDYDNAVSKMHEHNNKQILDNFSNNASGELLYNNKKLSSDWVDITNKPFTSIDSDNFSVDSNNMMSISNVTKQKTTLPTASISELNNIYQYVGATTQDLVNGFFYKCVEVYDSQNVLTGYEWTPLTIQPDAGVKIYATKTELGTHASSTSHITQGERTLWNNKAEVSDIPTKVSDLTDDVNLSQIHTHNNKVDVLDKLGVNSNNQLLFDGAMVASGTPISNDPKNIIVNKSDGLYVPETDLSDYSKTVNVITSSTTRTEKAIDNVIADSHTHTNKADVLDKLGVDGQNKLTYDGNVVGKDIELSADADNDLSLGSDNKLYHKPEHTHSNKTVLDGLDDNNGDLTYNGQVIKSDIDISSKANNALTKETDGYYVGSASTQISSASGNIISQKSDGIYASAPQVTVDISGDADNILVNKADGLYVPKSNIDISATNGNTIQKLADGLYVPAASVNVSTDNGNIIESRTNGIFAENKVESVNGISPTTGSKDITITLDNVADGSNRQLKTFETTDLSANYTGNADKMVSSEYLGKQFANKVDILDKLGQNTNGGLTFNGTDVATSSVNISADQDNIIENRTDGLYATVDLTPYETITHAQNTYATQAYAQNTHTLLTTDYLTKKDAGTLYMALAKYTDPSTNEIEGSSVKKQSIKYSDLDDVGQLDGVVLEQKLLSHLANTQIHNLGNLSSVLINSSEWNNGILTDFVLANDGTMQLAPSTTTTGAYTQNLATFVSKIYDVGDTLPFQLITFDAVYDPYIVNIKFYVRTGTTPTYSASDWTAWKDVTATKSLSGISTRYIQLKVEAQTANEYKNVKFNYIQMFYGQDTESEITEAREGLTVKHATLKQHFDDIENRTVVLETAVNKYSTLDQTDINDIVAGLDTIIATN